MAAVGSRHKRDDSDLAAPWVPVGQQPRSDSPLRPGSSVLASGWGGNVSSVVKTNTKPSATREGSGSLLASASPAPSGTHDEAPSTSSVHEAYFWYKGVRVRAKSTPSRLSWKPTSNAPGCCQEMAALQQKIPYDEILGAWQLPRSRLCNCFRPKEYTLIIYALARHSRQPSQWRLEEHRLSSSSLEVVKEWVALVNGALALCYDRPRNLLVFINPYSGAKRAREVWDRQALPVFQKARIKYTLITTQSADHAKDTIAMMKADELAQYQGVVAVGGDGVFQECIMGLLAQRARGGANAAAAARVRVGHIPGGSTDAVAYSLHGCRSAEAAALHIALGDRLSLDVGRVDSGDGKHRNFVCQAAYGFLGDVMRMSEHLRFMGPSRYDVAGALQFLRLRSYRLSISYKPAGQSMSADVQRVCSHPCEACRQAGLAGREEHYSGPAPTATAAASVSLQRPSYGAALAEPSTPSHLTSQSPFAHPTVPSVVHAHSPGRPGAHTPAGSSPTAASAAAAAMAGAPGGIGGLSGAGSGAQALKGAGGSLTDGSGPALTGSGPDSSWVNMEGEYISVKVVVTPCRSDKSKRGIIPNGHLSDGRMYLVLVSRCSHIDYLRFLIRLSSKGLEDGCFPFVKVIPVTAVNVTPISATPAAGGSGSAAMQQHSRQQAAAAQQAAASAYSGVDPQALFATASCGSSTGEPLPGAAGSAAGGAAGDLSSWNVDGELLGHNTVCIRVTRGLVDVFARGVELVAPTTC